jgi:hypothetical protein
VNLTLFNRDVLAQHPALLNELDQLIARVNIVWGKEHDPQTGVHTEITAVSVETDTITAGDVVFTGTTQTTVGAAGGASALPATPTGYWQLTIDGTDYVTPYYAKS